MQSSLLLCILNSNTSYCDKISHPLQCTTFWEPERWLGGYEQVSVPTENSNSFPIAQVRRLITTCKSSFWATNTSGLVGHLHTQAHMHTRTHTPFKNKNIYHKNMQHPCEIVWSDEFYGIALCR